MKRYKGSITASFLNGSSESWNFELIVYQTAEEFLTNAPMWCKNKLPWELRNSAYETYYVKNQHLARLIVPGYMPRIIELEDAKNIDLMSCIDHRAIKQLLANLTDVFIVDQISDYELAPIDPKS